MPKEFINDEQDPDRRISVSWGRDHAHVQLGVQFVNETFSFDSARARSQAIGAGGGSSGGHAETSLTTVIGAGGVGGTGNAAGGTGGTSSVATFVSSTGLSSGPEKFDSLHLQLSRDGINRLIKTLRRARDQAMGADA